jgi:UDP-N-acetylglucosamine 2-epimerase (non-hydrolysing)
VAIDRDADLLFAPTETAAFNLRTEKVTGEIYVTGNTSIDAVLAFDAELQPRTAPSHGKPSILVTCHRRESWTDGLESIAAALVELSGDAAVEFVLHPNPHVSAKMRRMLGGVQGISLVEACSHRELLQRMRNVDLVLSDSGGIQEEAPALGLPLLVLREKTERPEGIEAGSARLVGTSTATIVSAARQCLDGGGDLAAMRSRRFPYGDGKAAPRIARIISEWLERKLRGGTGIARMRSVS